ncbi:MAG: hypothetical protein ABIA47_03745 [bacterium]
MAKGMEGESSVRGCVGSIVGAMILVGTALYIITFAECIHDPHSRFYNHYPQCVRDGEIVVVTIDDVFQDAGDTPYTSRVKIEEYSDLFGYKVTKLEPIEDGLYNVTLWVDPYDEGHKERNFNVSACVD